MLGPLNVMELTDGLCVAEWLVFHVDVVRRRIRIPKLSILMLLERWVCRYYYDTMC